MLLCRITANNQSEAILWLPLFCASHLAEGQKTTRCGLLSARKYAHRESSVVQSKTKKPKKKKTTTLRNSVKYIWIGPESCNIGFLFFSFSFFWFFFFLCFLFFFLFFVFWVRFVSPGRVVYSGVRDVRNCVFGIREWEPGCVKHEKSALSQCPVLCVCVYIYIYGWSPPPKIHP